MQTVYGNTEETFSPLKVYIHIFLKIHSEHYLFTGVT